MNKKYWKCPKCGQIYNHSTNPKLKGYIPKCIWCDAACNLQGE